MYLVFIPKFPLLILLMFCTSSSLVLSLSSPAISPRYPPCSPILLSLSPSSPVILFSLFILCDFSLVWPSPSFIHSMSSTPSYPPSSLLPILPSSSPSPSFHSSSSFTLCHLLPSPSLVRVLVVRRDRPGGIDLTERFVLT